MVGIEPGKLYFSKEEIETLKVKFSHNADKLKNIIEEDKKNAISKIEDSTGYPIVNGISEERIKQDRQKYRTIEKVKPALIGEVENLPIKILEKVIDLQEYFIKSYEQYKSTENEIDALTDSVYEGEMEKEKKHTGTTGGHRTSEIFRKIERQERIKELSDKNLDLTASLRVQTPPRKESDVNLGNLNPELEEAWKINSLFEEIAREIDEMEKGSMKKMELDQKDKKLEGFQGKLGNKRKKSTCCALV